MKGRVVWGFLFEQVCVLLPTFRFFRPNDGGVNSRNAESKSQRNRNSFLQIVVQKVVVQLSQSLEIFVMVGINRAMPGFPGCVSDRPFRDHAQVFFARQRESQIDCLLVSDID